MSGGKNGISKQDFAAQKQKRKLTLHSQTKTTQNLVHNNGNFNFEPVFLIRLQIYIILPE